MIKKKRKESHVVSFHRNTACQSCKESPIRTFCFQVNGIKPGSVLFHKPLLTPTDFWMVFRMMGNTDDPDRVPALKAALSVERELQRQAISIIA
jgi:hypothetical protein